MTMYQSKLCAGTRQESKEVGLATVSIGLTEAGLKQYKDVLKSVVGYIQLMKDSGHQPHVFNELSSMASLNEIYSSKGEGMWRATDLANEAMMYPLEDVGRINYIYSDGSPEDYNKLLSHITPDNMLTMLIAKGVNTDKTEHFYQAPYSYNEDNDFYNVNQEVKGVIIPKSQGRYKKDKNS